MKIGVFLAFVCVWAISPALGNLIQNGSFESGPTPDTVPSVSIAPGSMAIPGWTVIGRDIDYVSDKTISGHLTAWKASDGLYSLDLNGGGGIQQTFATVSGTDYLVKFDMAGNYVYKNPKTMNVSVNGTTSPKEFIFDQSGATADDMRWKPMSFLFEAHSFSTTLQFLSTTISTNEYGPALDHVDVTAVPVPAAFLLGMLGMGVAGIKLRKGA